MRILLGLICMLGVQLAHAQHIKITVKMNIAGKATLPTATAVLMGLPDSNRLATTTITNEHEFEVAPNSSYLLKITSTEFAAIQQQVSTTDSNLTVSFTWQPKSTDLSEVTVVSRKPLITQQDDKTIVDAEVIASSSTNAYEVLEKTPGVIVDQDGNAYLNSTTPAMIQINGREVKLGASDLASLLKSLPANSIVKIEILRTPSAKYDAASSGGIVNIVLKKGVKLGTNGSVSAGYFQGKYNNKFVGFNLNRGAGKINSTLSYNYTRRNNFEEINSTRFSFIDSSLIKQNAYTLYPGHNHFTKVGVDIAVNKKLSVGYDGRFSLTNGESNARNDISIYEQVSGDLEGQSLARVDNNYRNFYGSSEIFANWKIDSLGSEWETELSVDFFRGKNDQFYSNQLLVPASALRSGNGDLDNKKDIITLETDLTLKLKNKFTLETGGRFNNSNSRNSALYFLEEAGTSKMDSFQTNRFRYREQIGSLYAQVSKTFAGFTLKPGLRMEYTNIEGNQLFPGDTSFTIHRTDFFPYVYLRHDLFKMMKFMLTGNLVYRRSISRPYYEALNPYPKYVDPYLFEAGNPSLRPQFTTTYEFNVQADNFPVFSIGINDIKDIISSVTYPDDSTRIVFRTFDNLGKNKETYLRVVGGIPPGAGKYFFYMGTQYNHSYYRGFYASKPLSYKRGTWSFFTYHNFKPTPVWNISLNGFMRLKGLQNFYEINTVGQLNLSVNRALFNKKMNVIVSFNDMFYTNKYKFQIDQPGIAATGERFTDTRRVGLTLRYNFGIKPKEEKSEEFSAPAEGAGN